MPKQVLFFALIFFIWQTPLSAKDHIVEVVTDHENGIVSFIPKNIVVQKGDTVTWVNRVDDLHNMITYPDGFPKGATGFSSPYLTDAGESWSFTFEYEGTYNYHCIPHIFMGMRGTVTVGQPSTLDQMNKPSAEEVVTYRTVLLEFFDSEDFQDMPDSVRRNTLPRKNR